MLNMVWNTDIWKLLIELAANSLFTKNTTHMAAPNITAPTTLKIK